MFYFRFFFLTFAALEPIIFMKSLKKRRIALGSIFFFMGLCFASWAARIPEIQAKFELSEGQLGTILLCLPIGSLAGLPIAGWMVHKFGSQLVILMGGITYALILLMVGLSPAIWVLVLVLIAFGMLGNTMSIALNTQAIDLEKTMGKSILASFHGLWSLAGFVGAGIGAAMILLNFSPAGHFAIVMGISFLILFMAKPFVVKEANPSKGGGLVLKRPDDLLLRVGLISFLGMMCEGCMFDWSGVYFKKIVEVTPEYVTLGYVAFMGAMASGRFITDRLTLRFGKVQIIRYSGILIFVGLLISVIFPTIILATLGFLLVGFGVAAIVPMSFSIAGRSKLYSPGIALALVSTIAYFGFLVGPPLIGFIADLFELKVSFALIAVNGLGITFLATYRKHVFFTDQQISTSLER